ncbi:DUF2600 family protein [Conexibacter arvalis]|uniref:Tetraprenyl-beta-curcumene synthase n=1 Tax=Conexibacter arvalis TaxID=912552 RepID=A0A840I920_9ACTN|nr:DUF2600 family protein [Conexibacter arvalis]MBB4660815.1 tetraprenyl-beta-curcumene synthase [Conexibacter arvalis]
MTKPACPPTLRSRAFVALLGANARYWTTVAPLAWRELRRWKERAQLIDDATLRRHALVKLREDDGNVKTTVTLATLAPRRQRACVVRAIVALQVMYDYLDAVSEERFADGARCGRDLFRAFDAAFRAEAATDYYRGHPRRDRSGYLDALATACREALQLLPRLAAVASLAAATAAHSGRAQELSHAAADGEVEPLAEWAGAGADDAPLTWWERAAGSAASILAVHALIAAAGDPRTTRADAERVARAYRLAATLTTLLDSLVDHERDLARGDHSYVSYYPSAAVAAERIAAIARLTADAAAGLRRAPHHLMTVAGIAAFYLSAPGSRSAFALPATVRVTAELRPLIVPILWLFRTWRRLRDA